jgi:hypothetical protein
MPAVSQQQRRFLFARFGSAWAHKHGFANKGKLPKYVHGRRMGVVRRLKGRG